MSATVSVIIPTFNRGYVIREAITSVLDQAHRDIEVIVVDDGSTDGTGELMATCFGGDPRVRYWYQTNRGASAARNTGLDLATGDYLAFLDSDDSWKPWHLSLMLACLDRRPEAGMIWTDTEYVDRDGAVLSASALTKLFAAYRHFTLAELFANSAPLSELGIDLPPASGDRPPLCGRHLFADADGQPRAAILCGHAPRTPGASRSVRRTPVGG